MDSPAPPGTAENSRCPPWLLWAPWRLSAEASLFGEECVKPLEFEQKLISIRQYPKSQSEIPERNSEVVQNEKTFIDRKEQEQGSFMKVKKAGWIYCTIISFRGAVPSLLAPGGWFCGKRFSHGWWGGPLVVQTVMPAMGSRPAPSGWLSS